MIDRIGKAERGCLVSEACSTMQVTCEYEVHTGVLKQDDVSFYLILKSRILQFSYLSKTPRGVPSGHQRPTQLVAVPSVRWSLIKCVQAQGQIPHSYDHIGFEVSVVWTSVMLGYDSDNTAFRQTMQMTQTVQTTSDQYHHFCSAPWVCALKDKASGRV